MSNWRKFHEEHWAQSPKEKGRMTSGGGPGDTRGNDMESRLSKLEGRFDTLFWGAAVLITLSAGVIGYQLNTIHQDIKEVRSDFKQEMREARTDLKQDLASKQDLAILKADLIQEFRRAK